MKSHDRSNDPSKGAPALRAVPRTAGRRPDQLPSGRHGIPRDEVAANQRSRIIAATAQLAHQRGYNDIAVEDIIARAGVSRRTFYEQFTNKRTAFLAAVADGAVELPDVPPRVLASTLAPFVGRSLANAAARRRRAA